jgi:hypothetical protein
MAAIKVGISDQDAFTLPDPRGRRRLLDRVAAAALDHVTVGDHISFHGGTGFDGLITASTLLASHESKGEPAIRRTAEFGDGWLGMFCSARRFAETRSQILAAAADLGRPAPPWFGVNVWCGLDPDPERARDLLAAKMERLYRSRGRRSGPAARSWRRTPSSWPAPAAAIGSGGSPISCSRWTATA